MYNLVCPYERTSPLTQHYIYCLKQLEPRFNICGIHHVSASGVHCGLWGTYLSISTDDRLWCSPQFGIKVSKYLECRLLGKHSAL